MTTVILAKTYADAAEVALGIGAGSDWLYPHDATMLRGLVIRRVVYVEGWLHSTSITVETAEQVQNRLTPDARVILLKPGGPRAEPQAGLSAPFVAPMAQEPLPAQRGRQRGQGTPGWLVALVIVASGAMLGGGAAWLADLMGWW